MYIKDAGEDGLLTSCRVTGHIRKEKLELCFTANGQNVQSLTGNTSLGVNVHQTRI